MDCCGIPVGVVNSFYEYQSTGEIAGVVFKQDKNIYCYLDILVVRIFSNCAEERCHCLGVTFRDEVIVLKQER